LSEAPAGRRRDRYIHESGRLRDGNGLTGDLYGGISSQARVGLRGTQFSQEGLKLLESSVTSAMGRWVGRHNRTYACPTGRLPAHSDRATI
jgi:hypothetical protein